MFTKKGFYMSKTLSMKELDAVIKQTRAFPSCHHWNAVIGVMALAGLKEVEVIELLSKDLDLRAGSISVRSLENPDDTRKIQISEKLLALLDRMPGNNSDYFFPNIQANNKKWYESSFSRELQKRLPEDLKPSDLSNSFGNL